MRTRLSVALNLVLGAVLAWSLLGASPVTSATLRYQTYGASGFNDLEYSTHDDDCDPAIPPANAKQGGENMGDLDNAEGSFVQNVSLPQGAVIKRFTLFVNDADMDEDVFAYLIRKRVGNNLSPAFSGYKVLAEVKSSSAVNATMRAFSRNVTQGGRVNNQSFYYFVEMLDCGVPEPFAVQVAFEPG